VLRPWSSPGLWPGGSSHPCARCGDPTAGLAPGDLCPRCRQLVTRKANRWGRIAAGATTLIVAGYLMVALGRVAPAWQTTARIVAAVATAAWYILTFRIVQRIALEWLNTPRP
jgi:hypothetical protein